jgi:hypothetical protein
MFGSEGTPWRGTEEKLPSVDDGLALTMGAKTRQYFVLRNANQDKKNHQKVRSREIYCL